MTTVTVSPIARHSKPIIDDSSSDKPLYVSRPLLPELSDFHEILGDIWDSKILTNNGPYCQRLESALETLLGLPTAKVFNNGTTALMMALKLFDLPQGSEVITTPLTFAATAHAISWMGLKPVFVDVLPGEMTLDPRAVEKAITPRTSAILGVHVYGILCRVNELQSIADTHKLRLIYDGAHAFAAKKDDRSVADYGDATIFSFHATKLFNTLEGGMVASNNPAHSKTLDLLRNFGIESEDEVSQIGINGKLNEIQAALGLLNLNIFDQERAFRAELARHYEAIFSDIPGITLKPEQKNTVESYQYFPIVIDEGVFGRSRDNVYDELKTHEIFSRKYFHPICTDFKSYKDEPIISTLNEPFVNTLKTRVLCLPFHSDVNDSHLDRIKRVFLRKPIK